MNDLVMGIDPGTKTLGVCTLRKGKVASVLQIELKKADPEHIKALVGVAIGDAHPAVVGLEDFIHQPWVAGGRTPKGAMAMQKMVSELRELVQSHGIVCYTQSPNIQAQYDTVYIEALIRKAMGRDFKVTSHLVSACKHALQAETTHRTNMRERGVR